MAVGHGRHLVEPWPRKNVPGCARTQHGFSTDTDTAGRISRLTAQGVHSEKPTFSAKDPARHGCGAVAPVVLTKF